ncbi:MAG TPA: spherulation-specific family 4 protein, partial [Nitrososphaeraceae archaeon]|nr:spherulation-specific family 4 protein [Nitrososphaeraceae archaeon]
MDTKSMILILLTLAVLVYVIGTCTFFPLAEATTGIMVALYFDPKFTLWDFLIDLKNQYPNVPIIAVINPDNGPGDFKNNTYAIDVLKLQAAGINVIGYTFTNYGQRDVASIFQDISKYTLWYNVDGIFFDEVASS